MREIKPNQVNETSNYARDLRDEIIREVDFEQINLQ